MPAGINAIADYASDRRSSRAPYQQYSAIIADDDSPVLNKRHLIAILAATTARTNGEVNERGQAAPIFRFVAEGRRAAITSFSIFSPFGKKMMVKYQTRRLPGVTI